MMFSTTMLPQEPYVRQAFDGIAQIATPERLAFAVASAEIMTAEFQYGYPRHIAAHLAGYGTPAPALTGRVHTDWQVKKVIDGISDSIVQGLTRQVYEGRFPLDQIAFAPVIGKDAHWSVMMSNLAAGALKLEGMEKEYKTNLATPICDFMREEVQNYRKKFQFIGASNEKRLEQRFLQGLERMEKLLGLDMAAAPSKPAQEFITAAAPEPVRQIDWDVYTHVHPVIRRQQGISVFKK